MAEAETFMNEICLVTYTMEHEEFTDELIELGNYLKEEFKSFKCIVFSEVDLRIQNKVEFEIDQIHMRGTKYKKLKYLMENDDSNYFISIDNDIKGEIQNLKEFIHHMLNNSLDVGWGKISAVTRGEIISKFVAVDKILSHNFIRPILWKLGQGISIPGQCFMIKRETFNGKLLNADTFLDDLALGLYVNRNRMNIKYYQYSKILGREEPNYSFKGLWKQRSRWAQGFASIMNSIRDPIDKRLIYTHAFSYHGLWIINWTIMFVLFLIHPLLSLSYIFCVAFFISEWRLGMIIYAIIYQFIFPVFHMRWMYCLKGLRNDSEK